MKLPSAVAGFVLDNCLFFSAGRTCFGQTLPGRRLSAGAPAGSSSWARASRTKRTRAPLRAKPPMRTSAATGPRRKFGPDCEAEACKPVQAWGFQGLGAGERRCSLGEEPERG